MTTTHQSFLNKARNDKFILVISPPPVLVAVANDLGLSDIQLSIYGSPVPAISIPSKVLQYQGQSMKVTSQVRDPIPPLTVKFAIDNEFKNYWFLWKWLDAINKSEESGMDPYFNNYSSHDVRDIVSSNSVTDDTVDEVRSDVILNQSNNQSIYHDYQVDLTLYGLDEYNKRKIKFTYTNAFITNLEEISYSYREPTECDCSVTFDYSQIYADLVDAC